LPEADASRNAADFILKSQDFRLFAGTPWVVCRGMGRGGTAKNGFAETAICPRYHGAEAEFTVLNPFGRFEYLLRRPN
jgi:hypothetical protein